MNTSVSSFVPPNRLKEVTQIIKDIDEVIKGMQGPHKVHVDQVSAPHTLKLLKKMRADKVKEREALLSSSIWRNSNGGSRKKMREFRRCRRSCRKQMRSRRN